MLRRRTICVTLPPSLGPDDIPYLCAQVTALLAARPSVILACELRDAGTDAVVVDALARLAVAARRHHTSLVLRNVSPDLEDLIELMGLGGALRR